MITVRAAVFSKECTRSTIRRSPPNRRITELDAIRGLAAMAVMIYHLKPQAFALHGVRVDLFLILSGYLLTSIILKKGDGFRFLFTFAVRRWLRLWPIYFLTLMLLVLANPWLPKPFPMDGVALLFNLYPESALLLVEFDPGLLLVL